MTSSELSEYIRRQKQRGVANIQTFEVEQQRRYAITAAAFILTVIGMTLSVKKQKGGMGLNIGIGLVLSFSYILFMTITQTFAISGCLLVEIQERTAVISSSQEYIMVCRRCGGIVHICLFHG